MSAEAGGSNEVPAGLETAVPPLAEPTPSGTELTPPLPDPIRADQGSMPGESRATAAITIPAVQNPHWKPCASRNACDHDWPC